LQCRNRDKIFPIPDSPFDFDRITAPNAFLQFRESKLHPTGTAGEAAILISISLFARITAHAGIEK